MDNFEYPPARKSNQEDDFHGNIIKDPYRWMEDPHDPETVEWMKEQNELVEQYINQDDLETAKARLSELFDYTRYGMPVKRENTYFYTKNDGLQPQAIYYMKEGKEGEEELLFDPNTLSEDGTTAVNEAIFSEDGKYVAFAISVHGSDWMHLKIMNTESKQFLEEKLENIRNFSSVQWKKDGSGFYYSAFVGKDEHAGGSKVWWHELNTPQEKDDLIFEHPEDETFWIFSNLMGDDKYLFLSLTKDTMPRNNLYVKREGEEEWIKLHDDYTYSYSPITVHEDIAYVITNENAPNSKIISIDLTQPDKSNWKTLVEETEYSIHENGGVTVANNHLIISYLENVVHHVYVFDFDGNRLNEIELPTKGTVGVSGRKKQNELFIGFTSSAYPTVFFTYDISTQELNQFFPSGLEVDQDQIIIDQVFYSSKDGTEIPMFIIHPPHLEKNGKNPTLLYGYGGFGIPVTLGYSQRIIHWVEQGGVFAIANLRGGGEYGEKWHEAGMLDKKQNVFDDFISAGEYLIAENYTSTEKLASFGGSNGGLLTAATMLQRPDLFGAVITAVGVLDMLRFHKYTIGRFWVPEYGNPENSDHYEFLIKYSPLHNIREVEYPPTFVTSADTDDRVDPSHSRKYVATLQDIGKGGPLLLRMVIKAGHGAGKPIPKLIEDLAYQFAFLKQALNMG